MVFARGNVTIDFRIGSVSEYEYIYIYLFIYFRKYVTIISWLHVRLRVSAHVTTNVYKCPKNT